MQIVYRNGIFKKNPREAFEILKKRIESIRDLEDGSDFMKYIKGLSFYIKKYNFNLTVDIKITSTSCDQCGEYITQVNQKEGILLNCGHNSCKDSCLQNLVENSPLTEYMFTLSKLCKNLINEKIIIDAFGGMNLLKSS